MFVKCNFASAVLYRNGQRYRCDGWDLETKTMLKWARGGRFQARVGRISLAVAVYCISQERNQRIFQNKYRNVDTILGDIESSVQAKVWIWSIARTSKLVHLYSLGDP